MSERVYKLLHGGELLVSEEVIGMRLSPEGMPITVDVNYVLDDVLNLVDHLRKQLDGTADLIQVKENALTQLKDANDELEEALTDRRLTIESLAEDKKTLLEEVEKWRKLAETKVVFASKGNDDYQYELQEDNMRLRKELEEAQRANDVMAKYLNELLHSTSNMVTASQIVNVLREAVGRDEFDPVGQEGEGNHEPDRS